MLSEHPPLADQTHCSVNLRRLKRIASAPESNWSSDSGGVLRGPSQRCHDASLAKAAGLPDRPASAIAVASLGSEKTITVPHIFRGPRSALARALWGQPRPIPLWPRAVVEKICGGAGRGRRRCSSETGGMQPGRQVARDDRRCCGCEMTHWAPRGSHRPHKNSKQDEVGRSNNLRLRSNPQIPYATGSTRSVACYWPGSPDVQCPCR
jgi:hypothetical protein